MGINRKVLQVTYSEPNPGEYLDRDGEYKWFMGPDKHGRIGWCRGPLDATKDDVKDSRWVGDWGSVRVGYPDSLPWQTTVFDYEANKDQFPSGAQRDKQDGKPQYGLISPGFTAALAAMLTEKAAHYGDRNWEKGIPTSRSFESLNRHTEAMKRGEWMDEESGHPHAVLAAANLMFIFEFHGSEFDTMDELMGPSLRRERDQGEQ